MTAQRLPPGLLLAAVSVLGTLGVVELAVRLMAGDGEPEVITAVDNHVGSRGGPDWRPPAGPPAQKRQGVFRILVVGDSFTWGSGVHPEDVWPRRLEQRLAELPSPRQLEVINWSRPGWNTEQAWASLRRRLHRLEPDLLLLGFTLNDGEPTGVGNRALLYEPLERRRPRRAPSRALHRGSALYRLLWERLENRRQRRAFTAYYRALFAGPAWERCQKALAGMRQATRELGIPMLLVVWPVFDSHLDDAYAYRDLHRLVAATAAELEIPVLDLLPTFHGIDARRLAVTPFTNPHPNELAHRIAADQVSIHLVTAELVPARFPMAEPPAAVRRRPPAA